MADPRDPQDDIIEGEEIEEPTGDATPKDATDYANMGAAGAMLNLEELIKNQIESLEKLREELKDQKEMYDDSFNNNPTHHELDEKLKEATKNRAKVRQQIAKQPSVALLEQKIKDLRFDIKEKQQTLSDLLADYKEQTGATQIETRSGLVMEIISTAKLVKKS